MVRLTGTVSYGGSPVCAMVLANGQYMFTCSGDGSYSLDVPINPADGSITLYSFCNGLPPYKYVFTTDQISFNDDTNSDGYPISQGDCNDFDASINPGATEICGDGIDQDCSGSDLVCQEATIDGTWRGTWNSFYGNSGQITVRLNQNGTNIFGTMDLTDTDCGDLLRKPHK
jgi:hypothetical protein